MKISGGRFIAETVKGYGVTHVFFMEAILRETLLEMEALGMPRVLAHTEKGAAYMADGYARVGRRPGLCMAQSVGAANLAAGLQDPYLAGSPVIAITGRRSPAELYRHAYQEIDHRPLFDAVTKFNVVIETAEQLPFLLRQAFREATSGAPGPVHLDVTDHIGRVLEKGQIAAPVIVEERFSRFPSSRPTPEESLIREAARRITKAERPVIVAGGGATVSAAGPEIVELAEKAAIPVATSLNGKGTILENHPLSLGIVGSYSRWCTNRVVAEADLVLFIGSHTGDQVTNNWKVPPAETSVIQIDIDPAELGRNYPNAVPLAGDAKVTVRKLIDFLSAPEPKTGWTQHARHVVQEWQKELEPLRHSEAVPIRPERLCKELTEVLPAETILVADTGHASIWAGTMVYLIYPGQRFIRAAGSLGWGFPASLGAKCAAPDRPVICFTGDGGFWYHLSEMETAVRCGISTVTVVNNNSSLSQDERSIRTAYGDRPGNREELFKFREVNFARIATEMGCLGIRVEHPDKIAGALQKALGSGGPAVVEVITDPACKAQAAWTPRMEGV